MNGMTGKIDPDALEKNNLAEIIMRNPGCKAVISDDNWWLYDRNGEELANPDDVIEYGYGYGSGRDHGGDVLQALASIVGLIVESV